jgi:hypothetical protein
VTSRAGRPAARFLTGFGLACRRYARVHQRGRAGRMGDRVLGPLPQALQRLAIAERDGGFQARAGLHLGQIHDGIDQVARPPGTTCPDAACSDVRAVPPAPLGAVTSAAATV